MWSHPEFNRKRGVSVASDPDDSPGPRAAHSCEIINGKLYLFGGWNGSKALNDMDVLDIENMQWSVLTDLTGGEAPVARNNHATAVIGSHLFIHGGHDGGSWRDDLHMLDVETREWSTPIVSGSPPSSRACHTASRIGRKIYMFGGHDGAMCFNDVDVLDLDTMTWIQPRLNGCQPLARNAHTMTVVGTKLVMFGGHSGSKHLHDLHILETTTMTWSQPTSIAGSRPSGLRGHTANLIGEKIFIFGGYDGRGRSNELFILNVASLISPPAAISVSAGAGGSYSSATELAASTTELSWEHPASDERTPSGRQRHTACLVGTKKLFIFGGFDGFKWLNDMRILDVGRWEANAITRHAANSLISNMGKLLNNLDYFPDITFMVEDKPIHAHKAILSIQCDQFRAMFSGGMKESKESTIVIPEWGYTAFSSMLEFLYTGSVGEFNDELALDLLGLADHYTLTGLKKLCENTLIHIVDVDNCCALLCCGHKYNALDLKSFCLDYILKNFENVNGTDGFEDLGSEPQLLLEVTRESMARNRVT